MVPAINKFMLNSKSSVMIEWECAEDRLSYVCVSK